VRVTFDSNVFVSALNYQEPPARLLELAAVEEFRLQLSAEILDETMRILANEFRWLAEDITEAREVLSSISQRVVPHVQLDYGGVTNAHPHETTRNRTLRFTA
jgi:predicted nucleic acid-binding protein